MPLPCGLLDTPLLLCALRTFVAALLSVLLPIVLVPPLLLLGMLLPIVLVLPLLLLSMLLPIVLVLPLLLLGVLLPIVPVLPLLLLGVLLRLLSMLLCGFGLLVPSLLLLGMGLLFALLLVLCVCWSSDSEKQRQNGCAGDSNCVHMCYLCSFQVLALALAQASSCRVH
jgi:hypothetical protein